MNKLINKYKKLSVAAKASLWAFIASVIQKSVSILATPIFTRILSTEEFAQYTLYQSWHDIFIIFSTLNVFNYAVYSGLDKYDENKETFISTSQILVTGLTLLCCIIYYIAHIFFGDVLGFSLPIVILMLIDILFYASFNIWAAKEKYDFKYKLYTILSIIIGVFGPIIGLALTNFSPNRGYGRIFGVAIVNILIGLIAFIINIKNAKKKFDKSYVKFIFLYCIPLIPHFLSAKILSRFDRIMINDMVNASKAGIYGLAYSLSSMMIIFSDAIFKSLIPLTYKTIKENKNLDKLKKNVTYITVFIAIINFLLVLFAPEIIKIFAPNEYYEAIYVIPPVSASIYLMYLFNLFANIEYYYSETKYVSLASIMAAVVNYVLNLIFIKKFGYLAAGYTTLASYILYSLGHFVFMKKVTKKHANGYNYYNNKAILLISVIFVISCILVVPIYNLVVVRYLLILILMIFIILNRKKIIDYVKKK